RPRAVAAAPPVARVREDLVQMMKVNGVQGLKELVGQHIGYSDWHQVTQEQVNLFADATGDHQWIHVDPERAKKGPFGGPIAHGYLTLSLLPMTLGKTVEVTGFSMGINYGLDRKSVV